MSELTDFVPTRASQLKNKSQADYQEITFVAYKPKKKNKQQAEETQESKDVDNQLDIKKARHEIIKFGMQAFDPLKNAVGYKIG